LSCTCCIKTITCDKQQKPPEGRLFNAYYL
jgi:hypothetical protein